MSISLMPFKYVLGIIAVYIANGLLVHFAMQFHRSPASAGMRIREPAHRRAHHPHLGSAYKLRNSILSTSLTFIVPILLYGQLFSDAPITWWVGGLQILALLVIYDFLYYFLHRSILHGPLHKVHAVHHRARHPQANDSFFLHPTEIALGVGLWLGCVAIVGMVSPMHPIAFLIALLIYTCVNIMVHCGLDTGILPYLDYVSRMHNTHHISMRSKNYASMSAFPDIIFRTTETRLEAAVLAATED